MILKVYTPYKLTVRLVVFVCWAHKGRIMKTNLSWSRLERNFASYLEVYIFWK